eukprot:scaffold109644_cov19-Tisochrysis_lutea.AAC.3
MHKVKPLPWISIAYTASKQSCAHVGMLSRCTKPLPSISIAYTASKQPCTHVDILSSWSKRSNRRGHEQHRVRGAVGCGRQLCACTSAACASLI